MVTALARSIPPANSGLDELGCRQERAAILEAAIECYGGGVLVFDKDMRLILCSRAQRKMFGYPDGFIERPGLTMADLIRYNAASGEYGPGDVEAQVAYRLERAARREPHCYERVRGNGDILLVSGYPLPHGGFVTIYQDVTHQRRAQAMIAHMAQHDPLTGLPNRLFFNERLLHGLAQIKRGGTMAVHFIDLDNFKPVNDELGHKAGDELLKQVAVRLNGSIRESDTIARLGGDEFALLQSNIHDDADVDVFANRILDVISQPFTVMGRTVSVGASIGIAIAPQDGLDADGLLVKADTALYRSKRAGRNRYTLYNDSDETDS